jgi:hypothetical protein
VDGVVASVVRFHQHRREEQAMRNVTIRLSEEASRDDESLIHLLARLSGVAFQVDVNGQSSVQGYLDRVEDEDLILTPIDQGDPLAIPLAEITALTYL